MNSRNAKEVHHHKLDVGGEVGIQDLSWENSARTISRKIREREYLEEKLTCSVLYSRACASRAWLETSMS